MKRSLFAFIVLTLVSLCFTSAASGQKFSKVVTDPDRWEPIMVDAKKDCTGAPEQCAIEVLSELNISVGDEPDFSVYRLGETEGKNVTVVFVSHLIEDDDSVLGELYRLELSRADAADSIYELDALGRMYQCMSGPVGWRKTPCP
ncbi:MAG: hypothetical protein AB7J13_15580 [Pyrinomonadaceae bacterium]